MGTAALPGRVRKHRLAFFAGMRGDFSRAAREAGFPLRTGKAPPNRFFAGRQMKRRERYRHSGP